MIGVTWDGYGDALWTDSVDSVEARLGLRFDAPIDLGQTSPDGCALLSTADESLGVITAPDSSGENVLEAFVVMDPRIRFLENGLGVGSSFAEVQAAWPLGSTPGSTEAGRQVLYVDPGPDRGEPYPGAWTGKNALTPYDPTDPWAPGVVGGPGAMFRFHEGVVIEWQVGRIPYAQHEAYCYTPE